MSLIDGLKNLDQFEPATDYFREGQVLEGVRNAVKNKDMFALNSALAQSVGLDEKADEKRIHELKELVLSCEWIEGFERLVEHYQIPMGEKVNASGRKMRSMLEEAAWGSAYWLVEHLWDRGPKEIQDKCIENHLGFGLAVVLAKRQETHRIKDFQSNRLLPRALANLSGACPPENREAVKEVVREVLKQDGLWTNVDLWKSVCTVDDVGLLKEMISSGVITEKNLVARAELENMLTGSEPHITKRISNEWLSNWNGYQGDWSTQAQEVRGFSVAELVCLFTEGEHKTLGNLLGVEGFRGALLSSHLAQHAFIKVCCESSKGVDLLKEAKAQGLDMRALTADDQMSPLHVLAGTYEESAYEHKNRVFIEMIKIHPDWATKKDAHGRLATDILPKESAGELLAMVEQLVLGYELSKKAIKTDETWVKKLRV